MTDRKFALKLLAILAATATNSSEFQLNNPIYGYWRKCRLNLMQAGLVTFFLFSLIVSKLINN